jgi:hypothetical protein
MRAILPSHRTTFHRHGPKAWQSRIIRGFRRLNAGSCEIVGFSLVDEQKVPKARIALANSFAVKFVLD